VTGKREKTTAKAEKCIGKFFIIIAMTTAIALAAPAAARSTVWELAFECSYWPPIFNMKNNINVTITTRDLPTTQLPRIITQDDVSAYTISDGIYNTRTHRDCELDIDDTECDFELELAPSPKSSQYAHLRAEFKEIPEDAYSHYTVIINTAFHLMSYVHSEFLNDRGMSYSIENGYSICSGLTTTRVPDPPADRLAPQPDGKTSAENLGQYTDRASR